VASSNAKQQRKSKRSYIRRGVSSMQQASHHVTSATFVPPFQKSALRGRSASTGSTKNRRHKKVRQTAEYLHRGKSGYMFIAKR